MAEEELNAFDLVQFDYNIEALQAIRKEWESIDPNDIEKVKSAKNEAVKLRRKIEDQGKGYRDNANAFNKRVLKQEKEYIEIIKPVEDKMKAILEEDERKKILEARKEVVPARREQEKLFGLEPMNEVAILTFDDNAWNFYVNDAVTKRATKEKEEKERKEYEELIEKDAEEKAQRQAEIKIEASKRQAEREKIEESERERKEAEENARKEREEEERAEQKRKQEENDIKFQDYLKSIGYDTLTDTIVREGGRVKVLRLISSVEEKDIWG